jgi:hypothetical protein
MEWRKIALRAFSFGVGAGLVCAILVAGIFIYDSHQQNRPWASPMRTTFTGLQIRQPAGGFNLEFDYAIENPTDKDYRMSSYSSVLMRLPDGQGYASGEQAHVSLENDANIPSKQKVNVRVLWSFRSDDYTLPDNDSKATTFADKSLAGSDGFSIFDNINRYRIDLPNVWKDWPRVKTLMEKK